MRKFLFVYFSLFISGISISQDKNCLEDVGDKMCLVSTEGKYGIINKKGSYIVPAYFDTIHVYQQGFLVKQNGKWGVFDRKGKIAIPIDFPYVRCAGDCDEEFLFEVNDIGSKSIYITKKMDIISDMYKVTPLLAVTKNEITIKDWFAYVSDVKNKGYEYNYGYLDALPDTNKVEPKLLPVYRSFLKGSQADDVTGFVEVKNTLGYLTVLKIYSYHDKKLSEQKLENMMNFPVTGLTYKQVERYTQWLTTIYKNEVNNSDDLPYEINFRLPKLEEWEKIADKGLDQKFKANKCLDSLNTAGCMLFNFNATASCKNYEDYLKNSFGKGSSYVTSFFPDNSGIYGLTGNVAEMVFENGLCKGGSYNHSAKDCAWDKTLSYEGAQPWLGFRVVAEFKAKK